MSRFSKKRIAIAAGLACLAILVAAPSSLADYRARAQYQVELSANNVGGVPGDGLWLWIELNNDGSGDYTGSVCIHSGSAGLNSAFPEAGDVTWSDDTLNHQLTIKGLVVRFRTGGQVTLTITVPDTTGHSAGPTGNYIAPNIIGGDAQVQVAP
jgi:hypothetical protein